MAIDTKNQHAQHIQEHALTISRPVIRIVPRDESCSVTVIAWVLCGAITARSDENDLFRSVIPTGQMHVL